ncbi:MAG: homoserine kinase [Streptosporangiaceae bacterium]
MVVRVPATSANLGPGFDAMGLALTLHDVVAARITGSGLDISVSGAGEETAAAGEDHLVVRAMRAAFAALGGQPPGIAIRCENAIPQGYGLGSSAAAIVAGLLAARALAGGSLAGGREAGPSSAGGSLTGEPSAGGGAAAAGFGDDWLLGLATGLEGHPDNVAACLSGGLTIAWMSASGARSVRLSPLAGIAPVICVPPDPLATAAARLALPPAVPHADAAQNSARAALLVAALTSDPGLLMDATEDFLHERYRAAAMPRTASLIASLRAAGIPAVVSGGGPAVLALTVTGRPPGAGAVAPIAEAAGAGWRVSPLGVDAQGAATDW